jgi:TrmH family RNA methyltransferase
MIVSKDNAKYKLWSKLLQKKYRQKEQLFLVEGEHLVIEANKAGVIVDVLMCEGVSFEIDAPVTCLSKSLFDKLASTVTSAGVMAVCRMLDGEITSHNRLLLVDDVQDPGNLGTLIRSALAFGFDGLIMSEDTVDSYNEKVVRATQGALFKLPMKRANLMDDVVDLQKSGVVVYAATLNDDAKVLDDVIAVDSMAFIVGNEGAGVHDTLVEICDGSVVIEMSQVVESLNVGVAGSILMHRFNGIKSC